LLCFGSSSAHSLEGFEVTSSKPWMHTQLAEAEAKPPKPCTLNNITSSANNSSTVGSAGGLLLLWRPPPLLLLPLLLLLRCC
jgi:hypothetical protein